MLPMVLIPKTDLVLNLSSGVFGMVEVISTSAAVIFYCFILAVNSVYQSFFEWTVIRDLWFEEFRVLAYICYRVPNESNAVVMLRTWVASLPTPFGYV
jgi:hypothetical protein